MSIFEELKQLSPVPVVFRDKHTILYENGYLYLRKIRTKIGIRDETHIVIEENLSMAQKLAVLAHELKHATDYKEGILDFGNSIKNEVRANKFALEWLYNRKQKKAIRWLIGLINELANNKDGSPHCNAAKKIKRTKIYKLCKEFVK